MNFLFFYKLNFKVIVICLLVPIIGKAQSLILKEEFNIFLEDGVERLYDDKVVSSQEGEIIYYTLKNPEKNKSYLKVYSYNTRTAEKTFIKLERTKDIENIFDQRIFSFITLKDKLILLNDDEIYSFTKSNGKLKLSKTQKNRKSYQNIYALNDSICLLYCNYNFHPFDQKEKHVWAKYFVRNDSISEFLNMPEDNAPFTHLTDSWISIYKGLIAYANTTDYLINFYDSNFKIMDSIKTNELESNKQYLTLLPFVSSSQEVRQISKYDDSLFTRIQKIFLIDSFQLLVLKKLPNSYKPKNYCLDLWKKIEGKWTRVIQETNEMFYSNGAAYTKDNQPLIGMYGDYDAIEIINRDFYFISYPYQKDCITKNFDRMKDYESPRNEMVRGKKFYFGIRKRRFVL